MIVLPCSPPTVDIGGEAAIYEQRQWMISAGTETYPVFILVRFFFCPSFFGVPVILGLVLGLGLGLGLGSVRVKVT